MGGFTQIMCLLINCADFHHVATILDLTGTWNKIANTIGH